MEYNSGYSVYSVFYIYVCCWEAAYTDEGMQHLLARMIKYFSCVFENYIYFSWCK